MTEPGNPTDGPDELIDIDVLVVGGGVQGLTLLRECTDRGYAAALVTNAPIGHGQTLHSHGFLNSGYRSPDPELRRSLEADWLPFLHAHGVEPYGADRFFAVLPQELSQGLQPLAEASGYPVEAVAPAQLPDGFQAGLPDDEDLTVLRIEEYHVPKRGLVRALGDGQADRILLGDVTGVRFEPAADEEPVSVGAVAVDPASAEATVTLAPGVVVAATGTGTHRFVEELIDGPSFETAAGSDADRLRTAIREQLDRVTYERAHMICVRGPPDVLPGVSLLLGHLGLSLVSADVDESHDSVDGDHRTWYVTPGGLAPEPLDDVPDGHLTDPDPAAVARGIEGLLEAYPPLRESLDELEFGVYAGVKQNVGASRSAQFCERLEGVSNLVVAVPSVFGGAWGNARTAAEIVGSAVEPSEAEPIPGIGEGVRVGRVVEQTDAFEWRMWDAFCEAYPDIDEAVG